MIIDLTENFSVECVDGYNYTLKQRLVREKGKKAGEQYEKTVGYFSRLEHAVHHAIMLRLCSATDTREALQVCVAIGAVLSTAATVGNALRSGKSQ